MTLKLEILALLGAALVLHPARAQEFLPFDESAGAEEATAEPLPLPERKAPEPEKDPEEPAAPASGAVAAPQAGPAAPPAPTTPANEAAPAKAPPADASAPPPAGGLIGAPLYDQDGPAGRVVSEKLVEERREPIGASALAPATRENGVSTGTNYRPVPGVGGAIGLPNLPVADVGTVGSVRLGAVGEVFSLRDFLREGDANDRQSLTLSLGWTPIEWLEAYTAVAFVSNTNTLSAPRLLQVQGDMDLGVKGAWKASQVVRLGADLRLTLFPSIGGIGYGAMGLAPRGLATFDLRPLSKSLPLLAHVELGFFFDGTGDLPGGLQLERIEEFALGVHRYQRFAAGLGLEAPLPWVTPFVAWRMRAPMGEIELPQVRDADGLVRDLTYGEVVSHVLTLGARVTALRDVSFLASIDLGLSGAAAPGIPATMPWNLMLGVSYVLDPLSRAERVTRLVERTVEVDKEVAPPPTKGAIAGVVRDAATGKPLGGVLVLAETTDALPVASAPEGGTFRTHELLAGEVRLTVEREGYESASAVAAVSAGQVSGLDFALKPVARPATLALTVLGKGRKPVRAKVEIQGPESRVLETGRDGKLETELPPGDYTLNVSADGHLTRQKNLVAADAAQLLLDVDLAVKQKRKLVVLKKDRLELRRQVHFQTGKSDILPDSFQLLDQVIDLIATKDIKRIRIEGHTDSQGSDKVNHRLSQSRADAVRVYLIEKGIAPERIEALGFGETRPIAPNLTKRGRAMNRRVEFHIVGEAASGS